MDNGAPIRLIVDASEWTAAVVRAAMPAHARRRGVVVLVHGRGPAPPWCPGERTIAGVVTACMDAGVAARWAAIGREPASLGALAELAAPASDRRSLGVALGGAHCELPRAWVGRHAVLVLPTVIEAPQIGAAASPAGPFVAALAALAVAARARGGADAAEVGAAVLARVFAGFTWVLDAERTLLRPRRAIARPQAASVDRVFVHGATGLDADAVGDRARALDRWLRVRRAAAGIELVGARAADPWPARASEPVGVDGPLWSAPTRREARRP